MGHVFVQMLCYAVKKWFCFWHCREPTCVTGCKIGLSSRVRHLNVQVPILGAHWAVFAFSRKPRLFSAVRDCRHRVPRPASHHSAVTLMETGLGFSHPHSTTGLCMGIKIKPSAHLQTATTAPKTINPAHPLRFLYLAVSIQSHLKCLQGIHMAGKMWQPVGKLPSTMSWGISYGT